MHTTPTVSKITHLTAVVAAVDLATKAVASAAFAGTTTGLIVPVENPEFSLGIASAPFPVMLALMTSGIVIAGVFTTRVALAGRLPLWVPALLIGGSLSNLLDRTLFGAVHDFLATPWAVLNLADLAVFVAVIKLTTHLRSHRPLIPTQGR